MSFNRYRAQTYTENLFNCNDFNSFFDQSHSIIESKIFTASEIGSFKSQLNLDTIDFFQKGYISLLESLDNFSKKRYSWATVKAYYSLFYFLKAELALNNYALVRHKCIYYLKLVNNAKLNTKGRNGNNRGNYSTDHKCAINYFKDFLNSTDILLSNNIESMDVYSWYMKKREQINYQERNFNEPSYPIFLEKIDEFITQNKFIDLIKIIINDNYTLTFQSEYAGLAIPIKRFLITKSNMENNGFTMDNSTIINIYNSDLSFINE